MGNSNTSRISFDTLGSPLRDSIFYIFPFWISLLYFLSIKAFPAYQALIFLLSYVFIAETHFASTWSIYLDRKNLEYYKTRKFVYFVIPSLIFFGCVFLSYFVSIEFVLLASSLYSVFHVSRQSVGFTGLFRKIAPDGKISDKVYEDYGIYAGALFFVSWGFKRFYIPNYSDPQILFYLTALVHLSMAVTGIVLVLSFLRFSVLWLKNLMSGQTVSATRAIVFLYSLLLYSPYAFMSRIEHAVAMGVGVHYLQYIGIMWQLNKNKYEDKAFASQAIGPLRWMSQSLLKAMPVLVVYAGLMAYFRYDELPMDQFPKYSWLYGIPVGLQTVHYFVDGFIWRFSNPFIRSTVAPFVFSAKKAT